MPTPAPQPEAVTGVQLAQGIGHAPSRGFWADAWGQVRQRPLAMTALAWVGAMAFLAVFAPLLASGSPLASWPIDAAGNRTGPVTSPWLVQLKTPDTVLLAFGLLALPGLLFALFTRRWTWFWTCAFGLVPAMLTLLGPTILQTAIQAADLRTPWLRWVRGDAAAPWVVGGVSAVLTAALCLLVPIGAATPGQRVRKLSVVLAGCAVAAVAVGFTFHEPEVDYDLTLQKEAAGEVRSVYTLVPFSPNQRIHSQDRVPPGTHLGKALGVGEANRAYDRRFILGTDANGSDVLSQLIHAARLALSIGMVSTGIALLIGVTIGALMGYFGGWVDLLLYRVVEVFMAVPVLFLLIVTVGLLPQQWRSTYVIMAIVGCFTWTGMARFTRAEFLKLRNQDFVQSAKAMGLPLRSILFKHMLPNGVAPVLVDTSFAVAAAISFEAVLSYLGLGPAGQASWGKLLATAVSAEGSFTWWLAVFPGAFIFLTVLSYNLVGEALRDAIDPRLKKARV